MRWQTCWSSEGCELGWENKLGQGRRRAREGSCSRRTPPWRPASVWSSSLAPPPSPFKEAARCWYNRLHASSLSKCECQSKLKTYSSKRLEPLYGWSFILPLFQGCLDDSDCVPHHKILLVVICLKKLGFQHVPPHAGPSMSGGSWFVGGGTATCWCLQVDTLCCSSCHCCWQEEAAWCVVISKILGNFDNVCHSWQHFWGNQNWSVDRQTPPTKAILQAKLVHRTNFSHKIVDKASVLHFCIYNLLVLAVQSNLLEWHFLSHFSKKYFTNMQLWTWWKLSLIGKW